MTQYEQLALHISQKQLLDDLLQTLFDHACAVT
jgi:hypothetical protein